MNRVIVCMLLVMTACTSSDQSKDAQDVVRKLFEAFNHHDWKTMASLYAEDAGFLDPSLGKEFIEKSREETIARYTELQHMFPDIRDTVLHIYSSGETVTVEFLSTGTAPDGTSFSLPIVSILTIRNGLIIRDATYYDL